MSDLLHFYIDAKELKLTEVDLFNHLRETNRSEENPVAEDIRYIYHLLPDICDIRGGYAIYTQAKAFPREGRVYFENTFFETGIRISHYMKGMEKLAVFICTAGENFTLLREQYNRDSDYLKAFIIDSLGSLVVEKAMDFIQSKLRESMKSEGFHITNRYSPGYCDWPLVAQQELFSVLPSNKCRINLTDSSLMLPLKSVSGIIGIGKTVMEKDYSCNICNNLSCIYRKIRQNSN